MSDDEAELFEMLETIEKVETEEDFDRELGLDDVDTVSLTLLTNSYYTKGVENGKREISKLQNWMRQRVSRASGIQTGPFAVSFGVHDYL